MNTLNYLRKQIQENLQTYAIIVAMVAIWIMFQFLTGGRYLQPQNISNLFRQMTVTAIMAVGMVFVIVTGNIDLSVGKLAGFVSVVVAYFQARVWFNLMPDQPVLSAVLSILIGLAVGVLFGVLQGWIIAYLRVPSFIVTLGGMWILNGAILVVTEGKTIPANQPEITWIAQGYMSSMLGWIVAGLVVAFLFYSMFSSRRKKQKYGFELNPIVIDLFKTIFFSMLILVYVYMVNQYKGFQNPVLLLAIVTAIFAYVATNTPYGRYAYAIGGNAEAARLSGISIRRNVFIVFVLMGLLCGVAGVVLASYVGYGTIAAGTGYELDVIGACILGGTSTLGGVGTVFGAIIGSLIMASLTNGLQAMGVAVAWQYIVKGVVLVLAVFSDVLLKR